VSGEAPTGANESDDLWYQWNILFDENFPAPQDQWSVVSDWHAHREGSPGTPQHCSLLAVAIETAKPHESDDPHIGVHDILFG
jgi:hypothetical protein